MQVLKSTKAVDCGEAVMSGQEASDERTGSSAAGGEIGREEGSDGQGGRQV